MRYPLHGRIANLPAHRVDIQTDERPGGNPHRRRSGRVPVPVSQAAAADHRQHACGRTGDPHSRRNHQSVREVPAPRRLLYHVNFGAPLLDEGARFVAPAATVVPRDPRAAEGIATWDQYGAPETGYAEQVYFLKLHADAAGNTQAMLCNARGDARHDAAVQRPATSLLLALEEHVQHRRRLRHRLGAGDELSQYAFL